MNRRRFIVNTSIFSMGAALSHTLPASGTGVHDAPSVADIYSLFKDPTAGYRPFVRWWWNGDKVEKGELSRELRLLREAGIGGVEINPIQFPARTDDMGKPSLNWLSDEWIDALQYTLTE